jgi:hypothetical protein
MLTAKPRGILPLIWKKGAAEQMVLSEFHHVASLTPEPAGVQRSVAQPEKRIPLAPFAISCIHNDNKEAMCS